MFPLLAFTRRSFYNEAPGGITLAYDLRLGRTTARWKGIAAKIHLGGSIRALGYQ
jgi:hypothetical protein